MSQTPESGTDDEVSLRPYFDALWRYRRVIQASLAGAAVLFAIVTITLYLVLPSERLGVIQFRLLFNGADNGHYPNGSPFNPTEIVATPVLTEVFASNSLERYTTFQEFQQSTFVLQSNPALQRLDYEYQAKLSNTQLGTVDRAKLEDEYFLKRDAIRDPQFDLSLRRAGRLADMPTQLMEHVLSDTLETWAKQTDIQKGAARPDVDLVSREVFARAAEKTESYLVRIDVLRTGAQRILKTLTALQEVPGARSVRTEGNRALADELATMEDIVKFDIEPLMGLARVAGGSGREQLVLRAYLSNQLVTYRLDLRAASTRALNLQTSLREYMAQRGGRIETSPPSNAAGGPQGSNVPMPQVSDSFIDRLMEMSAATQASESEYRRNLTDRFIEATEQAAVAEREIGYYEDLLKQLAAPQSALDGVVGMQIISTRFNRVYDMLIETVERVQKLYETVSVQTLNPSRRLYTVTRPFRLQTLPAIAPRTVLLGFALTLLSTLVTVCVGCLVRNSRSSVPTAATRQPPLQVGV